MVNKAYFMIHKNTFYIFNNLQISNLCDAESYSKLEDSVILNYIKEFFY